MSQIVRPAASIKIVAAGVTQDNKHREFLVRGMAAMLVKLDQERSSIDGDAPTNSPLDSWWDS